MDHMQTRYLFIISTIFFIILISACNNSLYQKRGVGLERLNTNNINDQLMLHAKSTYKQEMKRKSTKKFLKSVGYSDFFVKDKEIEIFPILYTKPRVSALDTITSSRLIDYLEFYPDCPFYGAVYASGSGESIMTFLDLSQSIYLPLTTNPCKGKMNLITNVTEELNFLKGRLVKTLDYAFFIDGMYDLICIKSEGQYFFMDINNGHQYTESYVIENLYKSE